MTAQMSIILLALAAPGAANDNNVEWAGISHIDWQDRLPLCPVDGESFSVSFQTYDYDLTSAQVYVDTGTATWIPASYSHDRGVYDVWTATIPASSPTGTLEYYFSLTDGTDTDYLGPGGVSDSAPASGWTLDFATTSHAPLGGTLTSDGGAVFKVWAPTASSANLAGTLNGWSSTADPMTDDGDYFSVRMTSAVAGDQYKYVFNGSTWRPDARGRAWNPGNNDNSFLLDPGTYVWGDQDFRTPPFEEMVIYELHVGTFSGKNDGTGDDMGTYRDVVDHHLDHLLYLGVNVVELMPITEFDYYESWGYNPVNIWGPENAYGSPDDLKYMIDLLHQNGIAVVMDIVYNHISYGGNNLWCYDGGQIYFDGDCGGGACGTPWGDQLAFWKTEVREYYTNNVVYWLDEFHADGFRMDATTYMRDPLGCYSQGWDLMKTVNDNIDRRNVSAISIAEELPNSTAITTPTSSGGAGFDAQWFDAYVDNTRQEIFDAAYGDPEIWKVRSGIDASGYDKADTVRYVESHDEAGDASGGERLAVTIDGGDHYSVWVKGRSKLAQGLTILVPGVPMFLQGGEWLEDIQFGSGYDNRIDWAKAVSRPEITLFFRDVIAARRSNCGFRADAGYGTIHQNDTDNVLAFYRGDGQELVVVANFGNNDLYNYNINFPHGGTWYEILNSQALDYAGNGVGNGGSVVAGGGSNTASLAIPQMGLLVFRFEDAPGRYADFNGDSKVDLFDYYILQQRAGETGCGMQADIRENGRVDSGDVAELVNNMTGPN